MNTKTINQKAKAYDMALEGARKELSVDRKEWEVVQQVLHNIFPELAESEDERIRKDCIHFLLLQREHHADTREIDDCIAYLEKQKEQKPVDKFQEYLNASPAERRKMNMDEILGDNKGHQKNPDALTTDSNKEADTSDCKYKNLDDIAQEYVDGVRQYNPEPTWDLMQTAVCYGYHLAEQKPVEKEITLTSFEGTLNTFLFDFANSPIEDCEPKEYIKKHSAEILKAAYKELNAKLQQDIFEARQEGIRDGYEVAKAEQKPAEIAPNQFDGITYGMQGYSTEKPVEWSEEDEKIVNNIVSVLGQYIDYKAVSGTGSGYATPRYAKEIDWLKSLPLNLKKKNEDVAKLCSNEWSEEEYGRLFDIEHYLKGTLQLNPDRKIACIDFLKSLRPQPKQEWSEEDEEIYKEVLQSFESVKFKEHHYATGKFTYAQVLSWLKSLRPSWEPSEEQMNKLSSIIAALRKDYCDDMADFLASIYHNLEKLI